MIHVGHGLRGGLLLVCVSAIGCGQQLTFERWQTIHRGMSRAQVQAALGKPWQTTLQTWVYYDEDRRVAVMVWYDDDKVIGTTWQSPQHGLLGEGPLSGPADQDSTTMPHTPDQQTGNH